MMISVYIPLPPRGQARARHAVLRDKQGNARTYRDKSRRLQVIQQTYKDPRQKTDEARLAAYLIQGANGQRVDGPIRMQLVAIMPVPKSWSKKKKTKALNGDVLPAVKPDLSNIIKHLEDVAQGIVFDDDKTICQITASKIYGSSPGYEVTFEQIKN